MLNISDRWRSEISCWDGGGVRFEPVYGRIFLKKSGKCVEKNFSPLKTRKCLPLSPQSTLKDAGALRWKISFSPLFTANLTVTFDQTSTREEPYLKFAIKNHIQAPYSKGTTTTLRTRSAQVIHKKVVLLLTLVVDFHALVYSELSKSSAWHTKIGFWKKNDTKKVHICWKNLCN